MENLKICPKCHKIMAYNSYFQKHYCTACGYMPENNQPNEQTKRKDRTSMKHHSEEDWI